jgi:DNA-binding response OmpR family regulator
MEAATILVIEDDDLVARTIKSCLRRGDYRVSIASSGVEGLKIARRHPPDLVILDVVMPGMDGYTVCREMRSDPLLSEVPVLFLTARASDEERIMGLRAGADDYLAKPFNVDELLLRVQAILRRTSGKPTSSRYVEPPTEPISPALLARLQAANPETMPDLGACVIVGDYILDTRKYELETPDKGRLKLTPIQYDLLYHLMSHTGEVFSPARLLDEVWDYPADVGSPDLVRVHIKNLRERVEPDPRMPSLIRTISGYGYTIDPA